MPHGLIDDLIPVILELNEQHWWPSDYHQFALISIAWLGPSRRYLYNCPAIRTFRACKLLARTLTECPHLRSLVRGIDMKPRSCQTYVSFKEDEAAGVRYILGLHSLCFLALGGHLAVRAERFLHMLQHPRDIIRLHVDGTHVQQPNASLEWDEIIAYKFINLGELRLTKLNLTIIPPTLPQYPSRIQAIHLQNVEIVGGILPDLCQDSWQSVRALAVVAKSEANPDVEQLQWTLDSCSNLERFDYEVQGSGTQEFIFNEQAVSYPSLRSLRLSDTSLSLQALAVIDNRCSNLHELFVHGRTTRITSDEWITAIRSGMLPSLKKLSICSGTNQPPFLFWTAYAKQRVSVACKDRGIDFV